MTDTERTVLGLLSRKEAYAVVWYDGHGACVCTRNHDTNVPTCITVDADALVSLEEAALITAINTKRHRRTDTACAYEITAKGRKEAKNGR